MVTGPGTSPLKPSSPPVACDEIILRLDSLAKVYPNGTAALRGVDLTLRRGTVHGLLGANGAGKSTLIKILAGSHPASSGTIHWRGEPIEISTPRQANMLGIATIHQHIPLVPSLSVIENVYLGFDQVWRRPKAMTAQYNKLCERVGYYVTPDAIVEGLSIGERQMVAIFQALATGADLIVMDEPTASLALHERALVYETIRRLSRIDGKAILFVSHFLDEIVALTDCVTVLRDGQDVMHADTCNLDERKIAEAIVGKHVAALEAAPRPASMFPLAAGEAPALELRELSVPGKLQPLNLTARHGEVIGIAGLLGSGRSELLHAIFGADRSARGAVLLNGNPVGRTPRDAVAAGIGLVPEDRMAQGLVPGFTVAQNTSLPAMASISRLGSLPSPRLEFERGTAAIDRLAIKARDPLSVVTELSGGNAQKVTIAKWLFSNIQLFLLDEPTAGIDIGAKTEILLLVRELSTKGLTVLIVSSDFEDLLAVTDRILVLRDGRAVAERLTSETSMQELLLLAGGNSCQAEVMECDA